MKILLDNDGYVYSFCYVGDIEGSVEIDIDKSILNNNFDKIKCYCFRNNTLLFDENRYIQMISEINIDNLREKRSILLKSFDIYKSNVEYGIIKENDIQKKEIQIWYKKILDLDEESILYPIEYIKKYL